MLFSHPHHHRHNNNDFILDTSSNLFATWQDPPDFPSPYIPALTCTFQPFEQLPMRSLNFGPIYSSPSYTLSAAIPQQPQPQPPPPSTPPSEGLTSPSPSPPCTLDRKSPFHPPPCLPSIHAFRLDNLESVDPSDDPCPLSLHDLMIPTEEQEYQGHSYHFSLQSVSPSKPKPLPFSDQKPPHEDSGLPKRKGKSKMHACLLCQKSFPRPSGLRTHMNSHSGDKRRTCHFHSYVLMTHTHIPLSL